MFFAIQASRLTGDGLVRAALAQPGGLTLCSVGQLGRPPGRFFVRHLGRCRPDERTGAASLLARALGLNVRLTTARAGFPPFALDKFLFRVSHRGTSYQSLCHKGTPYGYSLSSSLRTSF